MIKQYFTFGQVHYHKINGVIYDEDCVLEIESDTKGGARDVMFAIFGSVWSFQYDTCPDLSLFPRGIIKLKSFEFKGGE